MPDLYLTNTFKIHYLDKNPSGKQIVLLLHGLGANGSSWRLQIPALVQAGFRVIAPDARGFGKSGFPANNISIATMAKDFAILIQSFHVKPVHVVGISMGGTHALQLVLDNPDLIKSLVLVNTFASLQPKKVSLWIYYGIRLFLLHTMGIPTQAKFVAKKIFPRQEQEFERQELIKQIMQANPSAYRAVMRSFANFNLVSRLNEIKTPTLVITAEQDDTVSPENQKILAEKIVGARQIFVANSGHAVIVDQPELFNRILLDFLKSDRF